MRTWSVVAALGVWLLASLAHAHPLVDEGRDHFAHARFQPALDSFTRAEAATDLTRDDVVALLDGRCMVYLAMGNLDAMDYDIATLSAIDPEHRFAPEAPPALQESFDRAAEDSPGPLTVSSATTRDEGHVTIETEVSNVPEPLEHTMRIFARTGDGAFEELSEPTIGAEPTQRGEYYVEIVGIGGAVLVSDGSADDPRIAAARVGETTDTAPLQRVEPESGGISPWIFIIGGAVLVAGGVVGYLLWRRGKDDDTSGTPSPLVIEF